MTDDVLALARSHQWHERLRAVELLSGRCDSEALGLLTELLGDPNLALIEPAAAALLRCGEPGWTIVLTRAAEADDSHYVWFKSAFAELLIAGRDIEAELREYVTRPRSLASAEVAQDLLIDFRFDKM